MHMARSEQSTHGPVLGWLQGQEPWSEATYLQVCAVRQRLSWATSFWRLMLEAGIGPSSSPALPQQVETTAVCTGPVLHMLQPNCGPLGHFSSTL